MANSPSPKRLHSDEISYGFAKTGTELKVVLSEKEEKICDLLENVSDYIARERPDLPRIESRIAGGWVRDKLLRKDCHDLDVAVNDMMGYEFAQYINRYLEANGCSTRSVAKIDSNPEKSKHLETATTKLFDLEIDFCNLRTEVYSEDSRIPSEITFGTPTEDAYRRDITINSLFYNVHTRSVEDFTEQGITDLKEGYIRTPLAPFETFRDDPLRVVRCIRFASRFNFEMVPELRYAAKNTVIREALKSKISRERIGTELDKMLKGPSPLMAIRLIHELDLYPVMFNPPAGMNGSPAPSLSAVQAAGIIRWYSCNALLQSSPLRLGSQDELRILYLSAILLPYLRLETEQKKRTVPAVQVVLRDSIKPLNIKATNADINTISTFFRGIPKLREAAEKNAQSTISRSDLGMIIRDLGILWRSVTTLAMVNELLETRNDINWCEPDLLEVDEASDISRKYDALVKQAIEYQIDECYKWKYIVDGKRATQLLGIKPGPVVTQLLRQIMIWQLENPNGTEKECEDVIKAYWQQNSNTA
ncbi:CCA tRNA nucleotidyltransferase, mitochondrial [Apophysomyces ossiformis]|uniref:CCA tRNA nucleotidyltransferase, mitochondrial n=1 Tax=Apophysomyces ossiformis TaxID=679940 RepID=A0A8H7BYJ5_9FUNG|nr:CCA tRNA nucleotidyltransferase, mitochondrial [Apophysomyces ossiformis]